MGNYQAQRRQGLSRFQQPAGLLKTIKGRRENYQDLENMAPPEPTAKPRQPVADDAPPLSSDDEDYEPYQTPHNDDSSESDNDRHKNADIQPSFLRFSEAGTPGSRNAKMAAPRSDQLTKHETTASSPRDKSGSDPVGIKRSASNISGSHMSDPFGLTKRIRARTGYGKGSKRSIQKTPQGVSSSQDDLPKKKEFQSYGPTTTLGPTEAGDSSKVFKHHDVLSSPSQSPTKLFKAQALDSSPNTTPKKLFNCDKVAPRDTAKAGPPRKRSGSRKQARAGNEEPPGPDFQEDKSIPPLRSFNKHFIDDRIGLEDATDEDDCRHAPSTQRVEHILNHRDDNLDSSSDLSSLYDADLPSGPRCPMCDELVDSVLFKQHAAVGRMNIRQQTEFCRMHKRREAENARKTKGYPKIDWKTLESRFSKHDELIKSVLEGHWSSYFATALGEKVKAGESRTLLRSEESITPGYYGPRGLQVMTDYIMKSFSDIIRRRAVEDRLVSARGYSGYVQAVLVPELAVRLIMEDMSVSEQEARKVMLESSDVGELVHEEARDVVRWSDSEDD